MIRESFASDYHFIKVLKLINRVKLHKMRIKALSLPLRNKGGRSHGLIITPRRGNYTKRIYRRVDFNRNILPGHKAMTMCFSYDSIRSANICLVCYSMGIIAQILQPCKLGIGDLITNDTLTPTTYGDSASLLNIPSGRLIHNIHGKFIRSAGCSAILVRKDEDQALIKLKSGELRYFDISVLATLGTISNENHFLRNYKSAGAMRFQGFRPRTRPSSMNPVDHPMGGRTRGGAQPVNIKGRITLHRKTVKRRPPYILYTKRQLKILRR